MAVGCLINAWQCCIGAKDEFQQNQPKNPLLDKHNHYGACSDYLLLRCVASSEEALELGPAKGASGHWHNPQPEF